MRRALPFFLLLAATPASADQLVSGVSQELIQITSNYTGSDIVVFGAVEGEPGLYVCGLHFQHSTSSSMIHGAARDAGYVADKIGERMRAAPK